MCHVLFFLRCGRFLSAHTTAGIDPLGLQSMIHLYFAAIVFAIHL